MEIVQEFTAGKRFIDGNRVLAYHRSDEGTHSFVDEKSFLRKYSDDDLSRLEEYPADASGTAPCRAVRFH